jgi:hypothetical protein
MLTLLNFEKFYIFQNDKIYVQYLNVELNLYMRQNMKFFKTHKNLYTRPLCLTDPEYELYDQEVRSFGQFLSQTVIFQ